MTTCNEDDGRREWDDAAVAVVVVAIDAHRLPPRRPMVVTTMATQSCVIPLAAVVVATALEEERDGRRRAMGMMDAMNETIPPSPLREWDNAAIAVIVVAFPPGDKWQQQRWQHNRTSSPVALGIATALEEERDGQQRTTEMMDMRGGEVPSSSSLSLHLVN